MVLTNEYLLFVGLIFSACVCAINPTDPEPVPAYLHGSQDMLCISYHFPIFNLPKPFLHSPSTPNTHTHSNWALACFLCTCTSMMCNQYDHSSQVKCLFEFWVDMDNHCQLFSIVLTLNQMHTQTHGELRSRDNHVSAQMWSQAFEGLSKSTKMSSFSNSPKV